MWEPRHLTALWGFTACHANGRISADDVPGEDAEENGLSYIEK
jgi:hypothetical protein